VLPDVVGVCGIEDALAVEEGADAAARGLEYFFGAGFEEAQGEGLEVLVS